MNDENENDENEFSEPEEGDITSTDGLNWFQYGKLVLTIHADADRDAALAVFMDDEKFWPNCWSISDHGNAHLIEFANNGARVSDFTVDNMGIEHSQYFQGYGIGPNSRYTDCCYGIGDTPADALDDCLEQIAQRGGIDVEYLARRICLENSIELISEYDSDAETVQDYENENSENDSDENDSDESSELHYHVGIKWKTNDENENQN